MSLESTWKGGGFKDLPPADGPKQPFLAAAKNPKQTLNAFLLDHLHEFTREGSFPRNDSSDFRVFYVGRDDVHGVLKYLLSRCSRSLRFNMFGYDDDELDEIIRHLISSEHVYVQGTLDKSQSGGVHEKKILAGWTEAVRNSFAIGQSATHQISHSKSGVIDGTVGWAGSTNWSDSGEGTHPSKAQNNTLEIFVHPVQVRRMMDELDFEHAVVLGQEATRKAA